MKVMGGRSQQKIIVIKTSVTEQGLTQFLLENLFLVTPNLVLNICIFVKGPTIF